MAECCQDWQVAAGSVLKTCGSFRVLSHVCTCRQLQIVQATYFSSRVFLSLSEFLRFGL